jgi:hypothetical protein
LERQRKEKEERESERELNSNAAKRGSQFNSNVAKGKRSQFNSNTVMLRKVSFIWFLTRWSSPTCLLSHTDSFEPI